MFDSNLFILRNSQKIIFGVIFILIAICIFVNQNPAYDEPLFQANCFLFSEKGLTKDFLLTMSKQAPGPLYQFVHYIFKPLTGYHIVGMRLVNIFLLLCVIYFTFLIGKKYFKKENDIWQTAILFFIFPTTWICGGMAISQIPALFFAMAGLYFTLSVNLQELSFAKRLFFATLAGLFFGLSILGRIPYLIMLGGPILALLFNYKKFRIILPNLIIVAIPLLMAIPIFQIWNGLVPPGQQSIYMQDKTFYDLQTLLIAFVYLFILVLIINPDFLKPSLKEIYLFLSAIFLFTFFNYFFKISEHSSQIISKLIFFLPPKILTALPSAIYFTIACYVIYKMAIYFFSQKVNFENTYIVLAILGILFTSIKASKYSDTYIYQLLPLLILFLPKNILSRLALMRFSMLLILGIIFLVYRLSTATTLV